MMVTRLFSMDCATSSRSLQAGRLFLLVNMSWYCLLWWCRSHLDFISLLILELAVQFMARRNLLFISEDEEFWESGAGIAVETALRRPGFAIIAATLCS